MRKRYSVSILALAALLVMVWGQVLAVGQVLTVQVQKTQLRAAPSFTGKPVAALSNGQSVTVLEENSPWFMVNAPGGKGWVHQSAVAERKVSLLAGSRDAAATVDDREVSMAGKGFNQEIEQAYRKDNSKGYAAMEKMLRFNYTPEECTAFLDAGQRSKK